MGDMSRQGLYTWLRDVVESHRCPNVTWVQQQEGSFKIPWSNQKSRSWREEDSSLFLEYARHTGKYKTGDKMDFPKWKQNLKSAINKNRFIERLRGKDQLSGLHPYRVYRFRSISPNSEDELTSQEMQVETHSGTLGDQRKHKECESFGEVTSSAPKIKAWSRFSRQPTAVLTAVSEYTVPPALSPDILRGETFDRDLPENIPTVVKLDEAIDSMSTDYSSSLDAPESTLDSQGHKEQNHETKQSPLKHTLIFINQDLRFPRQFYIAVDPSHMINPIQSSAQDQSSRGPHLDPTNPVISGMILHPIQPELPSQLDTSAEHTTALSDLGYPCQDCPDSTFMSIDSGDNRQQSVTIGNDRTPGESKFVEHATRDHPLPNFLLTERREESLVQIEVLYGIPHHSVIKHNLTDSHRSCRLYHGAVNCQRMQAAMRGNQNAVEVPLPSIEKVDLKFETADKITEILKEMELGILITYRDGDIIVERRCRPRVYLSDGECKSESLTRSTKKREVEIKAFDFEGHFQKAIRDRRNCEDDVPKADFLLTIGYEILIKDASPMRKVPIYLVVRHVQAARERFKILGASSSAANPMLSDPNSFDRMAKTFLDLDLKKE